MKLNLKLVLATFALSLAVTGQNVFHKNATINKRGCATEVPPEEWDAWFNKKVAEYKEMRANYKTENVSITIPVIVHVIHGGSAVGSFPNISAAQIRSQINVLNKDFGGTGFNSFKLVSTGFSAVGVANTNITFCLAQYDPAGNLLAEPGTDRLNYNIMGWQNPYTPNTLNAFRTLMDNTIKPASIWDPTFYYNIWISDVNPSCEILGYATFPGGSGLAGISSSFGSGATDGIWVWSRSFGSVGILSAPYNYGRTASHETGHWLGLRHIGGDGNNNAAGDCNATDFCDDTPPQTGGFGTGAYGQNFGAPTYPLHANVCSSPFGDMFMNFMDYTDDAYNYMFTPDQNVRMQTALLNGYFRNQLSASSFTTCSDLPLADFILDTIACVNSGVVPFNATTESTLAPTYSWKVTPSLGVTFSPGSTNPNPAISFPSIGMYTVTMVATNTIGVTTNTTALRLEDCTSLTKNSLFGNTVSLAPNPTTGQLVITANKALSGDLQIGVYNTFGQLILSRSYNTSSESKLNIDLGSYPDGVYSVSISNGGEKIIKKLILNK